MKTTEYTVSRIVVQTISVLQLLINIVMFLYSYFSDYDKVEYRLKDKPIVDFSSVGLYICATNILFAVLAACSITSKMKIWMRFSANVMAIQMSMCVICATYFYFFYLSSIFSAISQASFDNGMAFINLIKNYSFGVVGNGMIDGFKLYVSRLVTIFSISQLFTGIMAYIQSKLFEYIIKRRLEKKPAPIPRIRIGAPLGMAEASLRRNAVRVDS